MTIFSKYQSVIGIRYFFYQNLFKIEKYLDDALRKRFPVYLNDFIV